MLNDSYNDLHIRDSYAPTEKLKCKPIGSLLAIGTIGVFLFAIAIVASVCLAFVSAMQ
jgi:hypothetical protein